MREKNRLHSLRNNDCTYPPTLQELGEQLLHGLGLVGQDHMVRVVDQLDPRLRQLLSEAGCRLWPRCGRSRPYP